jgi:hypothetical protein|tara:strand:+ start:700 stop:1437 length:738 start_codon:yes stop_codon:yes gene_type:complete
MARWSQATLVALGGFDKNVIIDELLYGEDTYYDITFLSDTLRTVNSSINPNTTAIIPFVGGDSSVFSPTDYVAFGDSSILYQILSVSTSSITLTTTPAVSITSGASIQVPINLTDALFTFRMRQQTATINDNGDRNSVKGGATITNIAIYPGSAEINLDANILTNVTGQSLALGQVRALINGGDLRPAPATPEVAPYLDSTTPNFFTGYIGVELPAPDISTPAQVKKQRICFVVRSDGTQEIQTA